MDEISDRLAALPGGAELLSLARRTPGVWLVGGAVRDLMLARMPRELDVMVEGDAQALALELARAVGGEVSAHVAFDTAAIRLPDGSRVADVARARSELYARPGALPQVTPADARTDLRRRDFTVNAMAVPLSERGEPIHVDGALEDLHAGVLRVLHDASFVDDPTRALRLARYADRLGFTVEPHTAALARAVDLSTVTPARIGAEVRLALEEPGGLAAVAPVLGLSFDEGVFRSARELLPLDGDEHALALAVLDADRATLERWEIPAPLRDRALTAARGVDVEALNAAARPSELRAAAAGLPVEAIALAGARGAHEAARRWLGQLRGTALRINGDDLLAAGVPQGPEIGRRLQAALDALLDGDCEPGRASELEAALRA